MNEKKNTGFAALILSLFRLYEICNQVNYSLQVLEERVIKTGNQRKQTERGSKKTYEELEKGIFPSISTPILGSIPAFLGFHTICML